MSRRARKVEPRLPCWSESDGFYIADKSRLEAILEASGASDEEIRKRMGHGYGLLGKALDGIRLTQYEVQHVEFGIAPEKSAYEPWSTKEGPLKDQ